MILFSKRKISGLYFYFKIKDGNKKIKAGALATVQYPTEEIQEIKFYT